MTEPMTKKLAISQIESIKGAMTEKDKTLRRTEFELKEKENTLSLISADFFQ